MDAQAMTELQALLFCAPVRRTRLAPTPDEARAADRMRAHELYLITHPRVHALSHDRQEPN